MRLVCLAADSNHLKEAENDPAARLCEGFDVVEIECGVYEEHRSVPRFGRKNDGLTS